MTSRTVELGHMSSNPSDSIISFKITGTSWRWTWTTFKHLASQHNTYNVDPLRPVTTMELDRYYSIRMTKKGLDEHDIVHYLVVIPFYLWHIDTFDQSNRSNDEHMRLAKIWPPFLRNKIHSIGWNRWLFSTGYIHE